MSLRAADLPKRITQTGITNAAGVCLITFRATGQVAWEASQITIEMANAPVGCVAELRVNDSLVTPLIPSGDAAAGDPPLPMYPGDVVTIRWTGATPNAQGKAIMFYRPAQY